MNCLRLLAELLRREWSARGAAVDGRPSSAYLVVLVLALIVVVALVLVLVLVLVLALVIPGVVALANQRPVDVDVVQDSKAEEVWAACVLTLIEHDLDAADLDTCDVHHLSRHGAIRGK